ncbi:MAG: AEC family transporter [Planctomycetota bacterium]
MSIHAKALLAVAVIVCSMAAGYLARRRRLLKESASRPIMTAVAVFGYSSIGFFSIWKEKLTADEAWLPLLSGAFMLIMLPLGMLAGRLLTRNRPTIGVFAVAGALANTGATMGGLLAYILYNEEGLRLTNIYGLLWTPVIVCAMYPVMRHYGRSESRESMGRLMVRNLLDWRSIGLPLSIVAIVLAGLGVQRPQAVERWHVIDVLVLLTTLGGYFAIGLRLHGGRVRKLTRLIVGLGVMRYVVGAGLAMGLAALAPWETGSMPWRIFLLEGIMPTAITMVAMANMFRTKPRTASALFVANTVFFLVVCLPIVLWLLGR